jgi:hypothetical protein
LFLLVEVMEELQQKLILAAEYGQKLLQQNATLQQEVNSLRLDLKRKVLSTILNTFKQKRDLLRFSTFFK